MPYKIGETVWYRGDEFRVTSQPFNLHGAEFQDIERLSDGATAVIPTPENVDQRVKEQREAHKRQQAAFRRLRK